MGLVLGGLGGPKINGTNGPRMGEPDELRVDGLDKPNN